MNAVDALNSLASWVEAMAAKTPADELVKVLPDHIRSQAVGVQSEINQSVAAHALMCTATAVNHRPEDCPGARKSEPTTAQYFGAYYRELIDEGIPPELAHKLVLRAVDDMECVGFTVGDSDTASGFVAPGPIRP